MKFNRHEIGDALAELLEKNGMRSVDLGKKIGRGGQGSIDRTRKGQQSPRLDIFLRWLEELKVTPSEFFRKLEKVTHESGLDLEPGYDDLYEMLTIILRSNKDLIHGIRINLKAISGVAENESRKVTKPGRKAGTG